MIRTKSDLKAYIKADFERQNVKHPFLAYLTYGEHALVCSYLKNLRKLEYYRNNKNSFVNKILCVYYYLKHRRNCIKMGLYISPNTSGPGLLLPHPGFIRIDSNAEIGENATILPMVLLGKKYPGVQGKIIIGNSCYIGAGVTILGPVKIGNNVTIGAGAVVTKDIPDNAVVGGVPAKVIKIKE